MIRTTFTLTKNQQKLAETFMEVHSKECTKISKEEREFMEIDEQATICSSYEFSFLDLGICDKCCITCTICGKKETLLMSESELEML